jgi:hypothetical protein
VGKSIARTERGESHAPAGRLYHPGLSRCEDVSKNSR